MYALQDKLLRSFQGRALAVRRATALNKGKTTAGIDGVLYTKYQREGINWAFLPKIVMKIPIH